MGEGSVSLTFIMIKEKPVYPYNTLSLKHRVPPHRHRHRRTFFLQPISHCEPHLHRAQPQRGGARGERRCQEQLTPPPRPPLLPKRASNTLLCAFIFSLHREISSRSPQTSCHPPRLLQHQPERRAVWSFRSLDEAEVRRSKVSVKVADESHGRCYGMSQCVCLTIYCLVKNIREVWGKKLNTLEVYSF